MKRMENFQMLPKELHQLKYEALSVPQGSVHLVKKTQERKSSTCYLLITKGVTSSSPVPLKTRRRVKFEQISVFERGRIVGLREAGLSYRAVAARVQRNSSTIMRVSKQWTDEGRTARKSVSGPRNVTSAREDRRLVRIVQTDRTAFSR
ncbi:transposable element Tc1 transposase [Trichonephila clavipes]|nr:transposable element Tc1 transposase [Trichonephila clavipes]